MSSSIDTISSYFQGKKLIIPILLGLGFAFWLIAKDFDVATLQSIQWESKRFWWIAAALIMVVCRDLGYVLRLRLLSDQKLSWKQCWQVTFLWEFASAISPGIVGGTAAAFVLLAQEKIGTGKSTAIVMLTAFLDAMFYILTVPLVIVFTGFYTHLPKIQITQNQTLSSSYIANYFILSYVLMLFWGVLVYIGIFKKPQIIGGILKFIFKLPILNRWGHKAKVWAEELAIASKTFKDKPFIFWLKVYGATFFSWVARFAVVNFLILIFGPLAQHLDVFIRQLIMWGILLIPVSPGATGLAEVLFSSFLGIYFVPPYLSKVAAVLWRLISYYPYLLIGFVLFPIWVKRIKKTDKVVTP